MSIAKSTLYARSENPGQRIRANTLKILPMFRRVKMKICLCGSTRFMEQFNAVNQLLTLQGHIVYSVAYASSQHRNDGISDEQKIALDLVHLRKILESDSVVVVGRQVDGSLYIGESTRREILWASLWEKQIHFWTKEIEASFKQGSPIDEGIESIKYAQMSSAERDQWITRKGKKL